MYSKNITYKNLTIQDINPTLLKTFNRFQETHQAWCQEQEQFLLKAIHFVDDWDADKKMRVLKSLQKCISNGGTVIGAFLVNKLIGFASVENDLFGKNEEYLELNYLHVSYEYRHQGIGKTMFRLCCTAAKQQGAKRLYIGAHPSIESQMFYKAMGCGYAQEINPSIYQREPLDIQMEVDLVKD